MRYRILSLILVLTSFTYLQSCVPDDDQVPKPDETDTRSKYTGDWNISENSQVFGTTNYLINIKAGSGSSEILLTNFYNLGFQDSVTATLSGTSISIPTQTVDGHTVSGSGNIETDKFITLNYKVNDGSGNDNVTAELRK